MISPKLKKVMEIVSQHLDAEKIPFAVIGAMALGTYGLPRFTADIDILAEDADRAKIQAVVEKLGFTCFQTSDSFAQFDSEMGVYGKIDCMFVKTQTGKDMLKRRITVSDSLMGTFPVICPEDYIVLKLMAIANNPERRAGDEADIVSVLKSVREKKLPKIFPGVNRDTVMKFAALFRHKTLMEKLWKDVFSSPSAKRSFFL